MKIDLKEVSESTAESLDRKFVLETLPQIPAERVKGYAEGLTINIDDFLILRSIISSYSSPPRILEHLVNSLSQDMLDRLKVIVDRLRCEDAEDKISEIICATLGYDVASTEKLKKAERLFSLLKNTEIDPDVLMEKIKPTQSLCLLIYLMRSTGAEAFRQRLNILPENEIDKIIEESKKIEKELM